MLMVLGFMAISIPIVTGYLAFTGTLSKDSAVKTKILTSQYASKGCSQYAAWKLNNEPGYADGLVEGDNLLLFDGCTITINKPSVVMVAQEVAYADVALVLDVSGSVDDVELEALKDAANDIVDRFSLPTTEGRVAIGVTRFRGSYQIVQGMTDVDLHGTSEPLHIAINGLLQGGPGLDEGTNLVAGLQGGGATYASGLGDRIDPPYPVPNIMVLITDGNDSEGNGIDDIIAASTASGAEVFAIGVGNGVNTGTINAVASQPSNTHAFTTNSYGALDAIIDDIVAAVFGAAGMGTLFTITSVSADGTVVVSQVLIPPA
ncbi:MAG: hypothetical protein BZY73_02245 [SAR202 cluster bacterium Casp-Chloro-G3]|nr:MAG: hypothetical protein BZY73_02245 [SAR202 cluster bacterium Casp-Chloro-G3]